MPVDGEVVEHQVSVAVAGQVDGEAPHRGQVQHAVRRAARRLVVGAPDEVRERLLDLLPPRRVVGEEPLPEFGVFGVGAAVLDLVLDLLAGAGPLYPEAEPGVRTPVLRRGQVVAEPAVAADRVRHVEAVVSGRGAGAVRGRDDRQHRGAGRVAAEREDARVTGGDRDGALEVLDAGQWAGDGRRGRSPDSVNIDTSRTADVTSAPLRRNFLVNGRNLLERTSVIDNAPLCAIGSVGQIPEDRDLAVWWWSHRTVVVVTPHGERSDADTDGQDRERRLRTGRIRRAETFRRVRLRVGQLRTGVSGGGAVGAGRAGVPARAGGRSGPGSPRPARTGRPRLPRPPGTRRSPRGCGRRSSTTSRCPR